MNEQGKKTEFKFMKKFKNVYVEICRILLVQQKNINKRSKWIIWLGGFGVTIYLKALLKRG